MADNNISMNKPLSINSGSKVDAGRGRGNTVSGQANFERISSKNPGHDGCNLSEEQVEAKAAEAPEPVETTQSSEQANSTQKVDSGNCPGGNVIEQILQDLLAALQDIKIGR